MGQNPTEDELLALVMEVREENLFSFVMEVREQIYFSFVMKVKKANFAPCHGGQRIYYAIVIVIGLS
jgi:hypothetical protein